MLTKIAFIVALSLSAGTAFAGPFGNIPDLKGFNASKNVKTVYVSGPATSGGPTDLYAVGTKHTSGNVNYGGTSASSYIFMQPVDPSVAAVSPSLPLTTTDSNVTGNGSWSAM